MVLILIDQYDCGNFESYNCKMLLKLLETLISPFRMFMCLQKKKIVVENVVTLFPPYQNFGTFIGNYKHLFNA